MTDSLLLSALAEAEGALQKAQTWLDLIVFDYEIDPDETTVNVNATDRKTGVERHLATVNLAQSMAEIASALATLQRARGDQP
jgi:hypothetical protein